MDRETLKKAVSGLEGIRERGRRLRCEACGEKNAKLMTGYYVTAKNDGEP